MNKANQISVVLQFNEYINSQDLDGLSSLMTDDHTLTTGSPILGKHKVLKHIQRLVPCIREDQVIASFAGLRPTIEEDDFYIREDKDRFVNIVGIKSPGLTAAPAVAEYVVNMLMEKVNFLPKEDYIANRRAIPRFRQLSSEERNRHSTTI